MTRRFKEVVGKRFRHCWHIKKDVVVDDWEDCIV